VVSAIGCSRDANALLCCAPTIFRRYFGGDERGRIERERMVFYKLEKPRKHLVRYRKAKHWKAIVHGSKYTSLLVSLATLRNAY
jgi:hypothetical protein